MLAPQPAGQPAAPPQPPQPPGMAAPPANVGPGVSPGANLGNMSAAKLDIGNGLKLLQRALPNIPMGSPLHTDILQTVQKISKHMAEEGPQDGGLHASGLQSAMRQQAAQAPQLAAMRAMGGGPSAPSSPPAMPEQAE